MTDLADVEVQKTDNENNNLDGLPVANEVTDPIVDAESIDPNLTDLKLNAIQNIASFFQRKVAAYSTTEYKEEKLIKWNQNKDANTPWLNATEDDLYVDIKYVIETLNNLNKALKERGYPTIPICRNMSETESKCEWDKNNFSIDQLLDLLWYVYVPRYKSDVSTNKNETVLVRRLKFHEARFAEAAEPFGKIKIETSIKKGRVYGETTITTITYEPFISPDGLFFKYKTYDEYSKTDVNYDPQYGEDMNIIINMSRNYVNFKQYICHYIYNIAPSKGGKNRKSKKANKKRKSKTNKKKGNGKRKTRKTP